ncbi:MAG: hypothetical protein NWE92_08395 [Candidatus Bathyarchaeota archaeon]|nr:hypothetical protein [Candidatus Bathyarchaeota archaeon]
MEKSSRNRGIKADALLCPSCCVEYVAVKFDLDIDGSILHDVDALKCPSCGEEMFTPQQLQTIQKRSENASKP